MRRSAASYLLYSASTPSHFAPLPNSTSTVPGVLPSPPGKTVVTLCTVISEATVAQSEQQFPDHHGGTRDPEASFRGRKTAAWITERATAQAHLASGESDLHQLGAGFCLKLSGHQDQDCNVRWVITRIEHTFAQHGADTESSYRNHFDAIPYDGPPLRPALREPPRVAGLRLGIVTNINLPNDADDEPGTTQDTGLYEVKFPSEQEPNGLPLTQRMRLAHPWAGPDRGFHFPLEVDDEVVVSHEHGDPARPFILGCLHNAVNKGPKITTTDGQATSGVLRSRTGHELRFDEAQGSGAITLISASKDHQLVFDDGNKQTALSTSGKYIITATNDTSISTDANLSQSAKGNASMSAQGTGTITAKGPLGLNSSAAGVTIESPTSITLKCGGSTIVLAPGNISITSPEISIAGDAKASVTAPQVVVKGQAKVDVGAPIVTIKGDAMAQMGGAQLLLKGDAVANLDGAMVNVTANGVVAIKGATINHN